MSALYSIVMGLAAGSITMRAINERNFPILALSLVLAVCIICREVFA